jgi:hypothetical protein
MTSDAVTGLGATIVWKDKTVGEGTTIRGPKISPPAKTKCSHFGSVKTHDYCASLGDLGSIHCECNLVNVSDEGQIAIIYDDGTEGTYTITYASGWGFTGKGVIGYEPSSSVENPEMLSFDIEMTENPTPTSPS